jgi:uncharacterized protein (DUF736 family)
LGREAGLTYGQGSGLPHLRRHHRVRRRLEEESQEQNRDYLSVKLGHHPSFAAPIYATLVEVEGEEGHLLIWSRSNRD